MDLNEIIVTPQPDPLLEYCENLEELIHSIQYKNNCINSLMRGNSEFSWSESIDPYLDSPTQENYELIVNFVRSMGGSSHH